MDKPIFKNTWNFIRSSSNTIDTNEKENLFFLYIEAKEGYWVLGVGCWEERYTKVKRSKVGKIGVLACFDRFLRAYLKRYLLLHKRCSKRLSATLLRQALTDFNFLHSHNCTFLSIYCVRAWSSITAKVGKRIFGSIHSLCKLLWFGTLTRMLLLTTTLTNQTAYH